MFPKDSFPFTPVFPSISSRPGAAPGANPFKTSLNLSTATPTVVLVVKSVNKPSVYDPSSASPIFPPLIIIWPFDSDTTSILLIESELIKVIVGDILASGFRVLSEWYSKPGSNIRTLLILFIFDDEQRIFELIPSAEVILEIPGIFLYPNPPDAKLIFYTPPDAVKELVE